MDDEETMRDRLALAVLPSLVLADQLADFFGHAFSSTDADDYMTFYGHAWDGGGAAAQRPYQYADAMLAARKLPPGPALPTLEQLEATRERGAAERADADVKVATKPTRPRSWRGS